MNVFLPGVYVPKVCSLCRSPSLYTAIIKIRISDPDTNKTVATAIDLYLCERHALSMDVHMEKIIKTEKQRILIFP